MNPTFDYLLSKYSKASLKDRAMKRPRSPVRQERREQPKQTKPEAKGKEIAEERYDPKTPQPAYFAHPFGHPNASSSAGFLRNQMQWYPPLMMPTYSIWDPYQQIWVSYPPMMPMTSWGWGVHRQPVFERLDFTTNDELIRPLVKKIKPINEEKVYA
jgi:hypothetical protein